MNDLDKEIERAMQVVNNLSNNAKAAGDTRLMYAANRAWNELFDARHDRATSSQRQGLNRGDDQDPSQGIYRLSHMEVDGETE